MLGVTAGMRIKQLLAGSVVATALGMAAVGMGAAHADPGPPAPTPETDAPQSWQPEPEPPRAPDQPFVDFPTAIPGVG
ncbi:hypothetical protein [Mycobacterium sp.]|uniref:hypothetical protein n=1 Tax=Mycobacterium sp. TaxID=1785 RepID=UPI003C78B547